MCYGWLLGGYELWGSVLGGSGVRCKVMGVALLVLREGSNEF